MTVYSINQSASKTLSNQIPTNIWLVKDQDTYNIDTTTLKAIIKSGYYLKTLAVELDSIKTGLKKNSVEYKKLDILIEQLLNMQEKYSLTKNAS